ncbi:hypothetical protein Sked_08220 [Sanguibacter keddieii DSM 10542]|uniref:DUF4307 domain-containing protein n=1 Tax=Sanguibacter keddieii (strain ATCC 51767 / DSM 10542 / NCFB 3025 / ST-74) TaxID=446469 RepID=D1BBZ3_SANKS|nr:DUF4307 domain-containing protein [Sanguibacter keddieii]ACZ20773.1 hypothetical protein Sked_08220 [Sanguibacter keddieii DSM 10542]
MTEHTSPRPDDARPHEPSPGADGRSPEQARTTQPGAPREAADQAGDDGAPRPPRRVRLSDEEASGAPVPVTTGAAAGRYDSHRGISRTTQVRLAVAAVTVAVLSIAWVTMGPSASTVRGKEFGFSVQGPEAVDITFDVAKPRDATVRCTVEALNENYAQVGTKEVLVGPAEVDEARYTTTIATTELAVTAVIDECVLVD